MKSEKTFTVRVRKEDREVEISIPLSERTSIGLDSDGTGRRAIEMVEEILKKLNKN